MTKDNFIKSTVARLLKSLAKRIKLEKNEAKKSKLRILKQEFTDLNKKL